MSRRWAPWPVILGMSVGLLARGPWQLRKQARKHLVPAPGEELTADSLLFGMVMRDRLTARGSVGTAAIAVAAVGLTAVAACLLAPTRLAVEPCGQGCVETVTRSRDGVSPALLAVLGAALVVGALAAVLARRRLRRLVPLRPAQHARRLVALTSRHVMLVGTICAGFFGIAWSEGVGRTDLFLCVGFAIAALLTLPALLVAWRASRSGPDDLALVDVLTIARTAKLPRVDTYVEGLVPAVLATD